MHKLTFDVSLAAQLKAAFARHKWTAKMIEDLCEGDILAQFREVMLGHTTILPVEYVIDCDAPPFVPSGMTLEVHQKASLLKWDPAKIELWYTEEQKSGKAIDGEEVLARLSGKVALNANVLDYLLARPFLIPEEWKGKTVFFWGTLYLSSDGQDHSVRYLYFQKGVWYSGTTWVGGVRSDMCPAAVLASEAFDLD